MPRRSMRSHFIASLLMSSLVALSLIISSMAHADDDDDDDDGPRIEWKGFAEAAMGGRIVTDFNTPDELTLAEARFRLEAQHAGDLGSLSFKGDFALDRIKQETLVEIREATAYFKLGAHMDVKAGQQVLTWGTGDLRFINDLFPKDWISFFTGRDDEYLKAPSLALRVGLYSRHVNMDLVWTPIFTPDTYPTGERLTLFNPMAAIAGGDGFINGRGEPVLAPSSPERKVKNGEFAGRLYGRIKSLEWALYGYLGFWKEPLALEAQSPGGTALLPTFSRLGVYGASLRGSLLGGIFNLEGGFYHSMDDSDGKDPLIPNHQARGLVGYEHEVVKKMTLGLQYYLEAVIQHDALRDSSLLVQAGRGDLEPDRLRHHLTLRLTYQLLRDDLMLSLFAFYSPNEKDAYLRPVVSYKISEAIKATVGANIVVGADDHTFFGRMKRNTNVYGRLRYSFATL